MAGLLPLLIALTIVETSVHPGRALAGDAMPLARLAGLVAWGAVLWLLLCETVGRGIALRTRTRPTAGIQGRRLLNAWDALAQAACLGLFAGLCYGFAWSDRLNSYTLALAPWALLQAIHWWCLTVPVRAVSGVPWTRGALVWHHLRFSLLPLVITLPLMDTCFWIGNHTPIGPWLISHLGPSVNVAGVTLIALGVIALMPWLLVRAWGARPLEDGPLRAELAGACADAGVRIGGILRWPVRGGRVYNAMVLGVLPRLRYVLFTDDLLRDFPPRERVAVLGHELGHARHHHLWIYLMFALATGLVSWSARAPLGQWLAAVPGSERISEDVRAGLVALALLAVQWRLLFGFLSRACERQADIAGAELAGGGDLRAGAETMREALGSVARLAGIDPRTPSWRHYSLHERTAWLLQVELDPGAAARHHRRLRWGVAVLAAVTGALLAVSFSLAQQI